MMARLLMLAAVVLGIIGLVVGFSDRTCQLGVTGWFTGGVLVAVLAIVVQADHVLRVPDASGKADPVSVLAPTPSEVGHESPNSR